MDGHVWSGGAGRLCLRHSTARPPHLWSTVRGWDCSYYVDKYARLSMQVELNTIASSFGCLSALMTRLHGYMASGRISGLVSMRGRGARMSEGLGRRV